MAPKKDIVLHKKYNSNRNKYKDSNNLSTNSINNWKTTTSQNVISDVINDDLAAPKWKNKFPINTTQLKLSSTGAKFNKRKKKSSLIFHKLDTPVCNKDVECFSGKPSAVDFDVVIDKTFKQESLRSSTTKNFPVNKVDRANREIF